jgi:hypothetical protein
MRIHELLREEDNNSPLLTVLQYLRGRSHDQDQVATFSTNSVINMVSNTGVPFDYDGLVSANADDPAVKELIKNFNRNTITLAAYGDETEVDNDSDDAVNNSNDDDAVSSMAKRALGKRR